MSVSTDCVSLYIGSPRPFSLLESPEGRVTRAEIWTPGDVRYAFIERKAPNGPQSPALFDEGLVVSRLESPSPLGLRVIDHLTNNVGMGEMQKWVDWYKQVFGFGPHLTTNDRVC